MFYLALDMLSFHLTYNSQIKHSGESFNYHLNLLEQVKRKKKEESTADQNVSCEVRRVRKNKGEEKGC